MLAILQLVGHEKDQLGQETEVKDQSKAKEVHLHLSLLKDGQGSMAYIAKLSQQPYMS